MSGNKEKLFNAIGKLKDSYIEEAYCEPNIQPKQSRGIKRLVMAAVAAVMFVTSAVAVAANSDAILSAIFERRKALVDDKIGHIAESCTEGNITLTMESVAVDQKLFDDGQFLGRYTISFSSEDGNFDGGLKYGGYRLEVLVDPDDPRLLGNEAEESGGRKWYVFESYRSLDGEEEGFCPFNQDLKRINYGLDNSTDRITLTGERCYGCYNTDFRIIFSDVTSYDGSIKYADELSVEFNVAPDNAKPLQQLDSYSPNTTFEIEGATFEVFDIQVNAEYMDLKVKNSKADRVNIAGTDCYAINYFTKLACCDEYFEKNRQLIGLPAQSEESQKLITEIFMLSLPSSDEKVLDECYELMVELKPESGAEITSISTGLGGYSGEYGDAQSVYASMSAKFSSPVYVEDIVRIYARKIGDPSKEITVWVPASDKGLEEIMKQ